MTVTHQVDYVWGLGCFISYEIFFFLFKFKACPNQFTKECFLIHLKETNCMHGTIHKVTVPSYCTEAFYSI